MCTVEFLSVVLVCTAAVVKYFSRFVYHRITIKKITLRAFYAIVLEKTPKKTHKIISIVPPRVDL